MFLHKHKAHFQTSSNIFDNIQITKDMLNLMDKSEI